MPNKYTILFAPIDAIGHVNASIAIAEQLRERGHHIVYATPLTWKEKLAVRGFTVELYSASSDASTENTVGDMWTQYIDKYAGVMSRPPIEFHRLMEVECYYEVLEQMKYTHERLKEIVTTVKPDVIICDFMCRVPALMDQGVPWILSLSMNPLGISDVNVPPAFSGYATDGDRRQWDKFYGEVKDAYKDFLAEYKKWILEMGGPNIKCEYPFYVEYSPYANIYMYPMELDYVNLRPNPPNWHRFDSFLRTCDKTFKVPEKLKDCPGKLIYFSMGTIGSAHVELMKKLISILAKSPNRFIVSKGPRGDELDVSDNMWGSNSVPQIQVIPHVDLVITHGGNNTITESFYFGKRVLVLPLLWDQLDNGQRIEETGLGMQLLPFKVTEPELLTAIQKILEDELLERRMISISQRIKSTNSQAKAAHLIEMVAANNRK